MSSAAGPRSTEGTSSLDALERWEPLLLGLLLLVYVALVFAPGFVPNPDSYYHIGCARLYLSQGWIASFPWLEYTALGPSFPNVHLLQHLVLVPIVALFEPATALQVSIVVLSAALAASVYLVLRRWRIPHAAVWTVLGATASEYMLIVAGQLKGGSGFFILLVWLVDAVWAGATRRVFFLSWLSVYLYVGAPVLLPIALVYAGVMRVWHGSWEWRLIAAVAGGLLLGLVINPFWPGHWSHIGHELASVFVRSAELSPGVMRGQEWLSLRGDMILASFAALPLLAWFAILIRRMSLPGPMPAGATAGMIVSMGLFAAGLQSGAKMLHLFGLASMLFVPLFAKGSGTWPRWLIALALVAATANGVRGASSIYAFHRSEDRPTAAEYRDMGQWLVKQTEPGEMVVAPWADFPGLFLFDTHNHYVVGMNVEFLQRADEERFIAYDLLYSGTVRDPETLLSRFFDGARHLLVRSAPLSRGEAMLTERLSQSPFFDEAGSPAPRWRVFVVRPQ